MTGGGPRVRPVDAAASESEVVAALPRSPLHLRLLDANAPAVDVVFYRDAHLERYFSAEMRSKAVFLGRESRWPADGPLHRVRRDNAAYYRSVAETVGRRRYATFILFLESEPLETFLVDRLGPGRIELWEEGLGHYAAFHGPAFYLARSAAQLVSGFYRRGIFRRRMDRARLRAVRDRFVGRDLALPRPRRTHRVAHDAFLFVGAPLAQDGWLTWRRYLWAMERLVCTAVRPIVYYPHPREDTTRLAALERAFGRDWFRVLDHDEDVAMHCAANLYQRYMAAFSTALLEVGDADSCAYVAGLFGLRRVHRELSRLDFIPARVIGDHRELAAFLDMRRAVGGAGGAADAAAGSGGAGR